MSVKMLKEPYNPLTIKEFEVIYSNALKVLSKVGISVPGEDAREIYRKLGCSFKDEKQTITIDCKIVEKALSDSRKSFVLAGRDLKHDIHIGERNIYFSSGGGSPNFLDHDTKVFRKVKLVDLAKMAHLIDYLPL